MPLSAAKYVENHTILVCEGGKHELLLVKDLKEIKDKGTFICPHCPDKVLVRVVDGRKQTLPENAWVVDLTGLPASHVSAGAPSHE